MTKINKSKKLLITGATGFVGRHLVEKIDKEKYDLALVVRDKGKTAPFSRRKVSYITFNKNNPRFKREIKKFNPEICIHLASYLTSADDTDALRRLVASNIEFGSHLLDALRETNLKYFINTGSFSEYYSGSGSLDPAYLYSATKAAFRAILEYYRKIIGFKVIQVIP